jgi:hypothetical protein
VLAASGEQRGGQDRQQVAFGDRGADGGLETAQHRHHELAADRQCPDLLGSLDLPRLHRDRGGIDDVQAGRLQREEPRRAESIDRESTIGDTELPMAATV